MKNVFICMIIFCWAFQLTAQKTTKKSKPFQAWIKTGNNELYKGYLTELRDSSVVLSQIDGNTQTEIWISNVEQLKFRKKGRMGRSVAIGAASGIVIGAIAGFAGGDDEPGWFSSTAEEKAVGGGILLLPIGAATGALVGSNREKYNILGEQENYIRQKDELAKFLKTDDH